MARCGHAGKVDSKCRFCHVSRSQYSKPNATQCNVTAVPHTALHNDGGVQ